MPPKFFITYSHQDSEFARRLTDDLGANGMDGFFDDYSIRAGDDFATRIAHGLEECDIYVPVLSPAALESPWCEREINTAIALSMERGRGGRPRIIPVIAKECQVPVLLRNLLYIKFAGRYDDALNELLTKGFGILPKSPAPRTLPEQPAPQGPEPTSPILPTIPRAWIVASSGIAVVLVLLSLMVWAIAQIIAPMQISTPFAQSTQQPQPQTPTAPKPTTALGIGSTKITALDGASMVFVPAGDFIMGSSDRDPNAASNEKPQHSVYLDAFWMDKFEVTNALYKICVDAVKCSAPSSSGSATRLSYFGNPQYNNYPVITISWADANTFCGWVGKRLPTEAEWEKAARGSDGRTYPWGITFDASKLNFRDSGPSDTTAVGSFSTGASPYGVMDMAGNVWEWVNDWYDGNYYAKLTRENPTGPVEGNLRVIRGGSWADVPVDVRAAHRSQSDPIQYPQHLGFRCAQNFSP